MLDEMETSANPPTYAEEYRDVMADHTTPRWLRGALATLNRSDPVDAANETDWLARLMEKRYQEIKKHAVQP